MFKLMRHCVCRRRRQRRRRPAQAVFYEGRIETATIRNEVIIVFFLSSGLLRVHTN